MKSYPFPVSHMRNDGPHHDRVPRTGYRSALKNDGPAILLGAHIWTNLSPSKL